MSERFLTVITALLTGDVEDEEKMTLICLTANQTASRNPRTAIIKIESNRRNTSAPSIYKSGEGLIYREFEDFKRFNQRYGWEIVNQLGYQDDKRQLFNFGDHTEQRIIFNKLCEMMDVEFVISLFRDTLEMPFASNFVGQYESFGDWA